MDGIGPEYTETEMATQSQSKPKVFISYAHSDSKVARELVAALHAEGFSTSHDSDVLPGESWAAAIDQQLRESDAMVVLLSPDWAASRYSRSEVSYALGAQRFEGRLIPVILKKTKDYPWVFDIAKFQMIQYKNPESTSREIARALHGHGSKGPASTAHAQEKRRSG